MKHKKPSVGAFGVLLVATGATIVLSLGCAGTTDDIVLSPSQNAAPIGDTSKVVEVAAVNPNAQTVRIGEIDWYVNYEDAMAAAQASNRPVWLHFGENPG